MRKLLIVLLLTCGVALGQMAYQRPLTLSTNGTGSVTFESVRGELDAIYVSSATTGTVTVAYTPRGGGVDAVNLATNVVEMQKVFRPVAQSTDVAGAGITSYFRYWLAGEDVTFSVADGASNAVWKVVIIVK